MEVRGLSASRSVADYVQRITDRHGEFGEREYESKTAVEESQDLVKKSVKEKVKGMNDFLVPMNTSLKFTMHDELQEYFVQIVDEATNEVIREIPPKKFLDMYAAMAEFMGLFVDEKR